MKRLQVNHPSCTQIQNFKTKSKNIKYNNISVDCYNEVTSILEMQSFIWKLQSGVKPFTQ